MSAAVTRAEKLLLAVMGLTTLGFGSAYMVEPLYWARQGGLAPLHPAALGELRGYYAGLQIGMGALFLSGLRSAPWADAGLRAAAVLFAGNGLGRIIGAVTAGAVDAYNLSGIVFEVAFSLSAIALLRARRRQESR